MSRTPKPKADKGSQKWLQILVNDRPDLFDALLRSATKSPAENPVIWLSPRRDDDYAEYRDAAFLQTLDVAPATLHVPLSDFWPAQGPVWDGLGKITHDDQPDTLLLVEAKAHIKEAVTGKSAAKSGTSIAKIKAALEQTKQAFAPNSDVEWSDNFYQYANRLAHLYWLRELNGLPAYMVFVYFVGDTEMNGPQTRQEWEGAIKLLETFMAIRQSRNKLAPYVIDLFVPVSDLQQVKA